MPSQTNIEISGISYSLWSSQVLIVGTGAASLNAAIHLYDQGVKDILIVTETCGGGTSNNSGSDKQTYYKLSVEGAGGDSPVEMARDLSAGGCMHGDVALVEATLSAQEFFHLAQVGVPFPHHRYGGYVGYKTDHDMKGRGTSAGPRTSNQMYGCLLKEVQNRNIDILDRQLIVSLLRDHSEGSVAGAASVGMDDDSLTFYNAPNVLFGTGGPGELYLRSVYPIGQLGSIGVALEAGASAQNLTESQFGLASTKFRWNLSGTYQQVLPRYFSVDKEGNTHDFLTPVFGSPERTADAIFLKGYQWPFDPMKIQDMGSSLVDILVYRETEERRRRVYMDFLSNISADFSISKCGEETRSYLQNSGALHQLPIERLAHMNQPAIDLYRDHAIDLTSEPLEQAVCAQHTNGGLTGDIWWQSDLSGFFPIGEVNGSHGVYRPGGSALNSGQAGGLRAAQFIAAKGEGERSAEDFSSLVSGDIDSLLKRVDTLRTGGGDSQAVRRDIQTRMTRAAGHIRTLPTVKPALQEATTQLHEFSDHGGSGATLREAFENYHLAFASVAYLTAIEEYLEAGGGSRGSALVLDSEGEELHESLPPEWKMKPEKPELRNSICEVKFDGLKPSTRRVPVRPVPEDTFWFETVWNDYMRNLIYDK